jgi:hypothetical protein
MQGIVEAVTQALASIALGLVCRVVVDAYLAKLIDIIAAPDVLADDEVRAVPLLNNPLPVMIEMIGHLKIAGLAGKPVAVAGLLEDPPVQRSSAPRKDTLMNNAD